MHHYEPGSNPGWRRETAIRSVLVVEPSTTMTTPLRRVASDFSDFTILSSPNAIEALGRLDHDSIGVVAVDIDSPSVNGFVLLQVLAKLHPSVIRIALSDSPAPNDEDAARLAHQVVEKPIDPVSLSLVLATTLDEPGFPLHKGTPGRLARRS